MKSSNLVRALVIAASMVTFSALAEDLGTIGPVYEISEESALETIMKRLKEKERTGELKKLQEAAVARSVQSAKNPRPVDGISTVDRRSDRLIDPTVTYTRAITTDDGKIVVPAGAKINPLVMMSLTKRLVFFDGRDKAQLNAVQKMVTKFGPKVKPILVAGSWYDTSKAWRSQVFYDQGGRLSERFGIRAVPSVISQQGALLLVQEIPAKELQ
jgi:conjugal transfer pilus assembly protein TraW